ncbi:hypothetical protein JR316_0011820 [Psilocybe cubensis]|uniref:Uncharacterized protein n=1 Tax=Psilocybe cubensis TaxID=181762 RepID=A0ACB8GLA2_PSICU|nr:hypothetical protein JR316_0011820 [Psilocybe cubensis]KAH9476249.1 hypothetical protein JR316_0011820 [Psilocybe cubensis]
MAARHGQRQAQPRSRQYTIIMAESAHLLWKLRCDRVINREGETLNSTEIKNKFIAMMNQRLRLDVAMCNPRYGKKATSTWMVQETWRGTLKNETKLPWEWIKNSRGVLVGIDPVKDDGRARGRTNYHTPIT